MYIYIYILCISETVLFEGVVINMAFAHHLNIDLAIYVGSEELKSVRKINN